jgi:hypothetical protein
MVCAFCDLVLAAPFRTYSIKVGHYHNVLVVGKKYGQRPEFRD